MRAARCRCLAAAAAAAAAGSSPMLGIKGSGSRPSLAAQPCVYNSCWGRQPAASERWEAGASCVLCGHAAPLFARSLPGLASQSARPNPHMLLCCSMQVRTRHSDAVAQDGGAPRSGAAAPAEGRSRLGLAPSVVPTSSPRQSAHGSPIATASNLSFTPIRGCTTRAVGHHSPSPYNWRRPPPTG